MDFIHDSNDPGQINTKNSNESWYEYPINLSNRNQWSCRLLQVTITIRYIDFGQITGFDRIFQSIIEYNCMLSMVSGNQIHLRFEIDIDTGEKKKAEPFDPALKVGGDEWI